ncbi:hypothetical protein MXB_2321 [Myxobolus squamalis]|nr:hypothetical protein MXB_2321 [Myxobolus squamalis]
MKKGRWVQERLAPNVKNRVPSPISTESQHPNMLMASSMFSLNVIFSRLFWDFWREQSWNAIALARIQRSLDRIVLPHYLQYLKGEDLNMGDTLPLIFSAESPSLDEDGVYVEKDQIELPILESPAPEAYPPKTTLFPTNIPGFPAFYSTLSKSTSVDSLDDNYIDDCEVMHENKQSIKSIAVDCAKKICKSAATHFENSNLSLLVSITLIKGTLSIYFPPPPTNRDRLQRHAGVVN